MDKINVISLGAGKQSSYMLLQALEGKFKYKPDMAIFSDVGCEPQYVYTYIDWLKSYVKDKYNFDIIVLKGRNLLQDTLDYIDGKNKRGASMPLYLSDGGAPIRRQCTLEYKIMPIRRYLQSIRDKKQVRMWVGISLDEIERIKSSNVKYIENWYPLVESRINISNIVKYFNTSGLPIPGKSSCLVCPFHSNNYWRRFKKEYPEEFKLACDFDDKIRQVPRMRSQTYLHRSLIPLRDVDLSYDPSLFPELIEECEGMCGL